MGEGRKSVLFSKEQIIFIQGDAPDVVFYIQRGEVRLTVVSVTSEEVTVDILSEGEFFGEGSLVGQVLRMGSATTMTDCELIALEKGSMMLALNREHTFSDLFIAHLLARSFRTARRRILNNIPTTI
jgi:CRP-like cAMP-binding protein